MRDRQHVFFQGPEGSGKTTLFRRLLESTRKTLWLYCRVRPAPTPELAGQWGSTEESRALDDLDLIDSSVYYSPEETSDLEYLFRESEFFLSYSEAIAYEGSNLHSVWPDLSVHVMRPLPENEDLFFFGEGMEVELDAREKEMFAASVEHVRELCEATKKHLPS